MENGKGTGSLPDQRDDLRDQIVHTFALVALHRRTVDAAILQGKRPDNRKGVTVRLCRQEQNELLAHGVRLKGCVRAVRALLGLEAQAVENFASFVCVLPSGIGSSRTLHVDDLAPSAGTSGRTAGSAGRRPLCVAADCV
jgi:hypothetical protein